MQLEIRGATVDVTTSGNTGRGVLLLHGFMCSAQMMSSVQEALCGNRFSRPRQKRQERAAAETLGRAGLYGDDR